MSGGEENRSGKTAPDEFLGHLASAAATVATWPQWKQNLIGQLAPERPRLLDGEPTGTQGAPNP